MIELNKVGELYYLAHKLANNCPDKYVSWFAVVNYFILFLNLTYRTCLRLFPGCHIANLYVGMEYAKSNNLRTALLAFQEAYNISNTDPLIFNEIGVVYYKQKLYEKAKEYFLEGIKACNEDKSYVYQSLIINLGHTLRKLK